MADSSLTLDHTCKTDQSFQTFPPSQAVRRFSTLGKEAALVFIGQAAAGIGSLVGVRLLTHLLPPAMYGDYALSLTVVLIIQYCYAGTSAAAMRFFVPALEKGQFREYLGAAWQLQHKRNLILFPLVLGGLAFILLTGHNSLIPLGLAAVVIAVVASYGTFMDGLQNAARQRTVVALHQGAGSWLRMGFAALLVVFVSASAASVLWGFALGAALTMASQYFFYRLIKKKASGTAQAVLPQGIICQWRESMSSYAWPYVIWCVPAWLQLASDRWALDWFASPAEVGIYAALIQLSFLPINTMTQLITQLITPILFARAGDLSNASRVASSRSLNTKLSNIALLWTIVAAAVTAVLQVPIGYLLLDPRYHGFLHLLPLLVLSAGLFSTGQLVQLHNMTTNRTRELIFPKIAVAVFACLMFIVGAYAWGITGVVWANVLANSALLIWISKLSRNISPDEKTERNLPEFAQQSPHGPHFDLNAGEA